MESIRNGALIASETGKTLSYGLANAQERGNLFVGSQVDVYQGMVVGVSSRDQDIEVNVCKGKNLTNMRSSGADMQVSITPPTILSLEQSLDFLGDDELLEATPKNIRIRKKYLSEQERKKAKRKGDL
jgi:GTP-binding protein